MLNANPGIVAVAVNPASGKDVRRLVARASVMDNQEKCAIVRRLIVGAIGAGARHFVHLPDSHGIAKAAFSDFNGIDVHVVPAPSTGSALDTTLGAAACLEAGCAIVVTLGGDGTNRAFVKGWRDVPLLPISTGTNNVFPRLIEATVAGAAAGLVACGAVSIADCSRRAKCIHVDIEGERDDLALIDAVLTAERFIGARALLESDLLRLAVLTRGDPAAVGMTAIGGLLKPLAADAPEGMVVTLGAGPLLLRAPIAPGLYQTIRAAPPRLLGPGDTVTVEGPGVLAFDGERERMLKPGQKAHLTLTTDGPRVVNVDRALEIGACRGAFLIEDGVAHAC